MLRVSVIVTTYQRPGALERVLSSLAAQEVLPAEVIVADDGSGPETMALVQAWQGRMKCPLIHVWQEDVGFRAAGARNRAVAASSGEYLVFLDGDCLVFPDFIQRHQALAEKGFMVMGSRILCSPELTEQIENGTAVPLDWGLMAWLSARWHNQVNRIFPLLRLPDHAWRKRRALRWRGVRTFNLAIWYHEFEQVNGFDEAFQGWGHEDADLAVRLIRLGVRRKDGQFALPVLHLWHRESDRGRENENMRRLEERLQNGQVRALAGLDQYPGTARERGEIQPRRLSDVAVT